MAAVLIAASITSCDKQKKTGAEEESLDSTLTETGTLTRTPDGRQDTTVTDLFIGMEEEEEEGYAPLAGSIVKDFRSRWYRVIQFDDEEPEKDAFDVLLRLNIDSIYPSQEVMNTVAARLDKNLKEIFVEAVKGDDTPYTQSHNRNLQLSNVKTSGDILEYAKEWFMEFDKQIKAPKDDETLTEIPPVVVSLVANRIYENDTESTYLLEYSYSYHGSNGCPSGAEYFTIDKATGKILGYDELIGEGKEKQVTDALQKAYEKQFGGPNEEQNWEWLSEDFRNNCARVKEGILFYYLPYSIGCGAEGEYFLMYRP